MADVVRGKTPGLSLKILPGYLFHGITAVLALWMFFKAIGWY
jgi:hypothetical protein